MTENTEFKRGKELVIGEVVSCGQQSRTITAFEPHDGLNGLTARVLKSGDYGITIFDDDLFRSLNGVYFPNHLWWHAAHGVK